MELDENSLNNLPEDLGGTPSKYTGKVFEIPVTGLLLNTTYTFQFAWVIKDQLPADRIYSPSLLITTPTESGPATPSGFTVEQNTPGYIKITWDGKSNSGSDLTNIDRVDIYIDGAPFDGTKPTDSFKEGGTKTIAAPAGTYLVAGYAVSKNGVKSPVSQAVLVTVINVAEPIEPPTNPNGFSIERVLGGIQVIWAGTYANGTFKGFEAVRIYVGNSATATAGTYKDAGVMTGNNVKNAITVPVDGTYLKYNQPVYIHAKSVNKNGVEGTLQENVANNSLGARSAISDDLDDEIITNAKLVADAVTAVKIATGAITETKIDSNAVTSPKIYAGSVTTAKLDSLAVTTEKIASEAITASKIKAKEIDVNHLAAGTISVNNLEAGNIKSTSYIRAGVDGGARVEISSSTVDNVLPGLTVYSSDNTPILRAPLTGGLTITGSGTFTGDISGATGTLKNALNVGTYNSSLPGGYPFNVSSSGFLYANSGQIGGWQLAATYMESTNAKIKMDSTSGLVIGDTGTPYLKINSSGITHVNADGSASGKFSLSVGSGSSLTMSGQIKAGDIIQGDSSSSSGYVAMYASTPNQINFTAPTMTDGFIKLGSLQYGLYYGLYIKAPKPAGANGTSPYIDFAALADYGGNLQGDAVISGGSIPLTLTGSYVNLSSYTVRMPSIPQSFSYNTGTKFPKTLVLKTDSDQSTGLSMSVAYGRALISSSSANPSDSIGDNGDLLFSTA